MTPATVTNSTVTVQADLDDVFTGQLPESPYRTAFLTALPDIIASARSALPECGPRIDAAAKLARAGYVKLLEDGTTRVAHISRGKVIGAYTVNGDCQCPDFPKAPHGGWCQHRIARGLVKQADKETRAVLGEALTPPVTGTLTPDRAPDAPVDPLLSEAAPASVLDQLSTPATGTPPTHALPTHTEAPASMNTYVDIAGYRVQVTLRTRPGEDETALHCRAMEAYLQQFPSPEEPQPSAPRAVAAASTCRARRPSKRRRSTRPGRRSA